MTDSHVSITRAAASAEERAFLDAIVDDLNDAGRKLVYADWLEEHGDSVRATFLRKSVAAAKTMEVDDFPDMPPQEQASLSWVRITGQPLERGMAAHGLAEHREALMKLAMPALLYETEPGERAGFAIDDQIPLGGTKFYGRPDLPPGAVWPRQKDCNSFYDPDSGIDPETYCSFVAQLNFADFAGTQAARFMPSQGLLSFFSCAEIESIGMVDAYVVYTPDTSNLVRMEPPRELIFDEDGFSEDEANEIIDAHRLSLSETLDIPSPGSESPFEAVKMPYSDARYSNIYQVKEDAMAGDLDSILGFTRPTSGDDPLPGAGWCKLLCVDNSIEMKLHFCIKTDDLKAAKFDEVELAWVDFD